MIVVSALVGGILRPWYLRRIREIGRLRATPTGRVPHDVYAASATVPPDSTSAS